ncbi:3-hydroxyacyl-CoA dehydrogenase [Niveomyces insectorum RCEF 264]|uniref:3-hydroxyacyl-CoA dehydrogenase n=1 Tax=Niveomyces insectorum RCEF 264 TaxID=1081102 RepID=A0A167SLK8_9HYPO|nr:3-hydroxyacyl-CoA dehydrogenase [Niveomyces insectorum RCEF 264]
MKEAAAHGFQPFHVRRSSTGIWAAIKRETLLALHDGVATPEEIDSIFKAVLKTPKGPCEQMDTVGLDVVLDIEEHYAEERPDLPEEPRNLLRKMTAEGRLGVKSGCGFFKYP